MLTHKIHIAASKQKEEIILKSQTWGVYETGGFGLVFSFSGSSRCDGSLNKWLELAKTAQATRFVNANRKSVSYSIMYAL